MADKRAFFKLDVGYLMNPKVVAVAMQSPAAVLLHVAAIGYAAQHLTDGVVPLALAMRIAGATPDDAELCFKHGLLIDRHDGDVEVHDYLEHQRSAAEAKAAETKAQRAARARWDAQAGASSTASGNASSMPNPMPREREEREERTTPTAPQRNDVTTADAAADAAAGTAPKKTRGTRIPDPFPITPQMVEWARRETPDIDHRAVTAEFIDYWTAETGSRATKLDWVATWRNWLRREQKRPGPGGRRIAAASPAPISPWDRKYKTGDDEQ